MGKQLVRDVLDFHKKCAEYVGAFEQEMFDVNMWRESDDMESPIEQILYCAFYTVARINFLNRKQLHLLPQQCFGKYRVDFVGFYYANDKQRSVIVECDSQQFHERSEEERRYEKARDRFLQIEGHKIFRFTGSEIKKEPFRVASEIIAYLTERPFEEVFYSDYLPQE